MLPSQMNYSQPLVSQSDSPWVQALLLEPQHYTCLDSKSQNTTIGKRREFKPYVMQTLQSRSVRKTNARMLTKMPLSLTEPTYQKVIIFRLQLLRPEIERRD